MPARIINVYVIEPPRPGATRTKFTMYRAIVPGYEFQFKRKADAVSFNDRLGDLLSARLRELNIMTTTLYGEYRRRVMMMDEMPRTMCANAFAGVDRQLALIMRRTQHGTGAYYAAVQHLGVWCSLLEDVAHYLTETGLSADTEARYAVRIMRDGIARIMNDVKHGPAAIFREMMGHDGVKRQD